jgi:hypothetical protein
MTSMPDDMQLGVRDEPGEDPAVDCRHDGVVIAGPAPGSAAVGAGGDALVVAGLVVAARGGEREQ